MSAIVEIHHEIPRHPRLRLRKNRNRLRPSAAAKCRNGCPSRRACARWAQLGRMQRRRPRPRGFSDHSAATPESRQVSLPPHGCENHTLLQLCHSDQCCHSERSEEPAVCPQLHHSAQAQPHQPPAPPPAAPATTTPTPAPKPAASPPSLYPSPRPAKFSAAAVFVIRSSLNLSQSLHHCHPEQSPCHPEAVALRRRRIPMQPASISSTGRRKQTCHLDDASI